MMKIEILSTFTGFPDDTEASRTTYVAGATVELADAFGAMIVAKGLAREVEPKQAAKPASMRKTGDES